METRTSSVPAGPDVTASPAEELPGLYRVILERVAELEDIGARAEAGRIRHKATEAYSRAWDASSRKSLLALLARANRAIEGDAPPRTWALRRRSAPAR
jgi:hypothetical protein